MRRVRGLKYSFVAAALALAVSAPVEPATEAWLRGTPDDVEAAPVDYLELTLLDKTR